MTRTRLVLTSILSCCMAAGSVQATTTTTLPSNCPPSLLCSTRKNIILWVADDLGAEDSPFFSAPIRWPGNDPHSLGSEANYQHYKNIRADWNRLAARMLAVYESTSGGCVRKTAGTASWPDPLVERELSPSSSTTMPFQYHVIPDDFWDNDESTSLFESEDTLYETGLGCGTDESKRILPTTGALAALRDTGVAVPRFYTTAAVCGPSRYSMITGRQWQRTTNGDYTVRMDGDKEVTIAEYLDHQTCGCPKYTNAVFGKWHVGEREDTSEEHNSPWTNGFDYGVVHQGNRLGDTVPAEKRSMSCRPRGKCLGPGSCGVGEEEELCDVDFDGDPMTDIPPPAPAGCCARAPNLEEGEPYASYKVKATPDTENSTRLYTELALEFLQKWHDGSTDEDGTHDEDDRFLLIIQVPAVHNGAVGVPSDTKVPYRKSGINGAYFGAIEEMDAAIGRIRNKLDALDGAGDTLLPQTLIFFTSDNGGVNRNAGLPDLRGNKRSSWEGGIRVGLVGDVGIGGSDLNWPTGAVMSAVDLFPTFAAAAGVPVADDGKAAGTGRLGDRENYIDGKNLYPLLMGTGTAQRDFAFARGKGSAIMARQDHLDDDVVPGDNTPWPPSPSPGAVPSHPKGVCALVDEAMWDADPHGPLDEENFVPRIGASCAPCDDDDDCRKSGPSDMAYADCTIIPVKPNTLPEVCNYCVPAQWKVRSKAPDVDPNDTPNDDDLETGEELFDLSSDPIEALNCAKERYEIWFDLKCRLWRWHECVNAQPDGEMGGANRSCETDDMLSDDFIVNGDCQL